MSDEQVGIDPAQWCSHGEIRNDCAVCLRSERDAAINLSESLLAVVYGARERMIGSGPGISALREQTDSVIALAERRSKGER